MRSSKPTKPWFLTGWINGWIGLGLGAVYWFLDAFLDALVFDTGGFVELLVLPTLRETFMRLLVMASLAGFGLFIEIAARASRRAEQSQLAAAQQFRDMFEAAPIAYFTVGVDGCILMANRRAADLTGYRRHELTGRPVFDLYADTASGKARAREVFSRFLAGQSIDDEELEMLRADGTPLWIGLTVRATRDAEGNIIHARSMAVDITARKEAAEALRGTAEERSRLIEQDRRHVEAFRDTAARLALEEDHDRALQDLVDVARDAIDARYCALAIWDEGGRAARWVVSGISDEQSSEIGGPPVGLGVLDTVGKQGQTIRLADIASHPDFRGFPTGHPVMKSFLGVPIGPSRRFRGAFYLADKAGGAEFTDNDERLVQLLALLARIMHENAEAYRHAAEERSLLATVLSSISEGLMVLDRDGTVIYFNEAAESLLDLAAESAIGKSAEEVIRTSRIHIEAHDLTEVVRATLKDGVGSPTNLQGSLDNHGHREFVATAFPIPLEQQGRMAGLMLRDITEETALDRRRNVFVSIASHEMRTPLTAIVGFAELLLTKELSEQQQADSLGHIYRAAVALTDIVDDVLNVSRIQSGSLRLAVETIQLADIIDEVLCQVESISEGHELVVELGPGGCEVGADADKLTQVLHNLISNAIKYSPGGGRITIAAREDRENARVIVSVADEGIGIAPEDQAGLFTIFHRIERPETRHVRGTGLGLYITKGLIELMGGEVWVESELDKGSTFYVSIPTRPVETMESLLNTHPDWGGT